MALYNAFHTLLADPKNVTLRKKTGEGDYLDHQVQYVQRAPLTQEDVTSGEATLDGTWVLFTFFRTPLNASDPGLRPALGDKVVDEDGVSFTVRKMEALAHATRFRCLCREDVT